MSKATNVVLWVGQVAVAGLFGMAGLTKLTTPTPELIEMGMGFASRLPEGSRFFVGGVEVLGAVGLILPAALRILPWLTPAAAAGLVLTMIGATLDHAVAGEVGPAGFTVVLGVFCAALAFGRARLAPIQPRGAATPATV